MTEIMTGKIEILNILVGKTKIMTGMSEIMARMNEMSEKLAEIMTTRESEIKTELTDID